MKSKVFILTCGIVIFAAGIAAGFAVFQYASLKKNIELPDIYNSLQIRAGSDANKLTNPLLACGSPDQYLFTQLLPLRQQLSDLVNAEIKNQTAKRISIYYRDLSSGQWAGINEDDKFSPASLVKVPLLLAYYKEAENHPEILDKQLQFADTKDADQELEVAKPPDSLAQGKSYPVSYLIYRMIVYSGNNSFNMLMQSLNIKLLTKVYDDLQVRYPEIYVANGSNWATAKSFSNFFRVLYNATYLNNAMSEKALGLLAESNFKEGLVAGVPNGIIVAHKFGERTVFYDSTKEVVYRELHDCGIVYDPKRPYILCVMTQGSNFENLKQVVSKISKTTYDTVKDF